MLGIIRKDLPYWLYLPAIFTLFLNAYWLREGRGLRAEPAVVDSFFIYFLAVWPIVTVEGVEERFRGYAFLGSLPLRVRDIVTAKFVMPLVMLIALVAIDMAVLASLGGPPELLARCSGIVFFNACFALDVAGLAYVIVYRFGVRSLMVPIGAIVLVLNILGILAMRRLLPGLERALDAVGSLTPGVWPAAGGAAALAIYAGLREAAIRIKSVRSV